MRYWNILTLPQNGGGLEISKFSGRGYHRTFSSKNLDPRQEFEQVLELLRINAAGSRKFELHYCKRIFDDFNFDTKVSRPKNLGVRNIAPKLVRFSLWWELSLRDGLRHVRSWYNLYFPYGVTVKSVLKSWGCIRIECTQMFQSKMCFAGANLR